jgi:hypothetical protein
VYDFKLDHRNPLRHPMLAVFDREIRSTLAIAAEFFDQSEKGRELTQKYGAGYFIRASLLRLFPGGELPENRDEIFR